MDSEELYRRTRERHFRHSTVAGICRLCVMEELEEMILEEHPGMARGDAFDLVQEWFMTVDDPVQ